ncbi:single-strand binding protein [Desulfotomaculum nigrificans CO-1-SRB]|uniref:Single-stranded DNA-binding protein n=1 Tax=Desulfotomaculum nigrificans (strain DSM 14880 / VKM B-2319 / CO-1-SRB) TaxID=868595 RepID=F6B6R2_DESCC|nr:single-stranded DNA-binding protein [Desulfotomaculum nigrificans]AEF95543.1 single-strand binding protein [Desulfotomaculum nigrificans CO-1-SRB]
MLNKIILIGRLTRDPELRYTTNGTAVAKFSLAVDRPQFNKEKEKETDFIDVVVWSKLAEICANNLGKGRLVAVEGRLQIRSYDDNQGIRRKAAEVVAENVKFLDWPKDRDNLGGGTGYGGGNLGSDFGSEISFNGDDIPF